MGRKPNADHKVSCYVKLLIGEMTFDARVKAKNDNELFNKYFSENVCSLSNEFLNLIIEFGHKGYVHYSTLAIAVNESMERSLLGKEHEVLG